MRGKYTPSIVHCKFTIEMRFFYPGNEYPGKEAFYSRNYAFSEEMRPHWQDKLTLTLRLFTVEMKLITLEMRLHFQGWK